MNLRPENMLMINDIMQHDYKIEYVEGYIKYINIHFDIFIKSNASIIVIDKRKNQIFRDLKTAHSHINRV